MIFPLYSKESRKVKKNVFFVTCGTTQQLAFEGCPPQGAPISESSTSTIERKHHCLKPVFVLRGSEYPEK
jgi:hypothetical protein